MTDLFELRKKDKIPPFFSVVEEAHIFCPERSFGETKASKIFRTIASEGRKFGLGLAVISQRPARVDKSVLSQCSSPKINKEQVNELLSRFVCVKDILECYIVKYDVSFKSE